MSLIVNRIGYWLGYALGYVYARLALLICDKEELIRIRSRNYIACHSGSQLQ